MGKLLFRVVLPLIVVAAAIYVGATLYNRPSDNPYERQLESYGLEVDKINGGDGKNTFGTWKLTASIPGCQQRYLIALPGNQSLWSFSRDPNPDSSGAKRIPYPNKDQLRQRC